MTVKIPLISDWNIITPTVFRFMKSEHVNTFFNDGELRISSISHFRKYSDEQRTDTGEGTLMFVHNTKEKGGQAIKAWATVEKAYVLSCTMLFTSSLMKKFNADSYIKIKDTTNFGAAITRHIPGFKMGFEGPCLYQSKKIFLTDLGYIDTTPFLDPNTPDGINTEALNTFIFSSLKHIPYFLKDKRYMHQCEYRFIWITEEINSDYVHIRVPEALRFCDKPDTLLE